MNNDITLFFKITIQCIATLVDLLSNRFQETRGIFNNTYV